MNRDIIIIGAGIIGCTIARELSKYDLSVSVIEKADDVASGISKANSGIIHAGFNEKKGTLKAKFNIEGNKMYDSLSKELDFSFHRNGALVLGFNDEDLKRIEFLKNNGQSLGIDGLKILSKDEIKSIEPNISDNVNCALYAETSGIINPYEATVAFAENACQNGVEFIFNSEVTDIKEHEEGFVLSLSDGRVINSRIVINSAGLHSDDINNLINSHKYALSPVKGEYLLLDKSAGSLVKKTVFKVPTEVSKGILVTPTTDGNLLVGPNAENTEDRHSLYTDHKTIEELLNKSSESVCNIPYAKTLTTFSGLRPHLDSGDFVIEQAENSKNFISLVGIESPGLTAAPAIAVYVKDMISKIIELKNKDTFTPYRKGIVKFTHLSLEEKNQLIAQNPSYGKIVCKCELITEGEIIDAIHRPLGAKTVDAIKKRTRATMGGCQGNGCMLTISRILSRELGISLTDINKNSNSSPVIGYKEV